MFNKELLETSLNAMFKGKEYSHYFAHSEIERAVVKLFEEANENLDIKLGIDQQDYRSKYMNLCIKNYDKWGYKQYPIASIEVSKTKNWKDEYFYKSIKVCQEFDLRQEIERVDKLVNASRNNEQRLHNEGVACLQQIRALYPNLNAWQLKSKLDYIVKHYCSLEDEVFVDEKR